MLDIMDVNLPIHSSPDYYCRLRLLRENAIKVSVLTGVVTVLISCGIGEASPAHPTASSTPLREIPTQTWTPTITTMATETPTPTEIPIYTEAEIEKANVFKAETFPDRFKKVAEDPVSCTDKEWQDYQVWTEALREKFFKQEGFTVDLKNIIDPENMTSLWKILSWQEKNKDRVVKEDIRVLATPLEIVGALTNRQQIITLWEGILYKSDEYSRQYGLFGRRSKSDLSSDDPFQLELGYPFFSSNYIPGFLLNRNGKIPRSGFFQAVGDVAGVAQGRFGREDETIVFLHLLDKTGKHTLFPLIFPYGEIIIPVGTYCIDLLGHPAGIPFEKWPKPLTLPKDFRYEGKYSPEYFLYLLGKTISVDEISTTDDPSMEKAIEEKYGILTMRNPLHPYFNMEMGGYVVDWHGSVENASPNWPWEEFPYLSPTQTSTQ